jgi:hypothetical protein
MLNLYIGQYLHRDSYLFAVPLGLGSCGKLEHKVGGECVLAM